MSQNEGLPTMTTTTTTSSSSNENNTNNHRPWIERYRPKSLKEVSHQQEVVATLQNATETGRLPHLLFYGPPGSGKVRYIFCNLYLLFVLYVLIESISFEKYSLIFSLTLVFPFVPTLRQ
jgi:hypothetical protein